MRYQWGAFVHLPQHNFHLKIPKWSLLQFHLLPAQLQGSGCWVNLPWPSQAYMHMAHFRARVNLRKSKQSWSQKAKSCVSQKFVSEPELIPNLPNPKYCHNCWKAHVMLQERFMLFDQYWVCPKIPLCDSTGGRRRNKVLLTLNQSLSLKITRTM